MRKHLGRGRTIIGAAALATCLSAFAAPVAAQWATTYDQFYLPAEHNWEFRQKYASADRLFNAFDYGHAILYETLWNEPAAPVGKLEDEEYDFLTRQLLVHPPRVPIEEGAIEVAYAKLAPEAKMMFDWAHLLHRQIYDVWADESIPLPQKDARIAELLAYYKTRPDIAFSSVPKSMDVMDGQYFSGAFREKYPKFNGLIWAYHWLQVGLYEPLMAGRDLDQRQSLVNATVGRFWQMLRNPPQAMPYLMPMTSAVAPTFAQRYPEAGAIFDNLHMMHDVISDILVSPEVPRKAKRDEILRQVALFRSDTAHSISQQQWLEMGEMMGVNNMGGPAVGFLAELPTPTVPRGMSMAGMGHGNMPGMAGMQHGNMMVPGHEGMQGDSTMHGMQHGNMPGMQGEQPTDHAGMPGMQDTTGMPGMDHSGMGNMPGMRLPSGVNASAMQRMMEIHMRMMADPVIRERVRTDLVLQQMMRDMPDMMQMMQSGRAIPMDSTSMPGMEMGNAAAQAEAVEFIVRLLSDPEVEARVHSDPKLHRLWSDPEVQARLRELRQARSRQSVPDAQHKH